MNEQSQPSPSQDPTSDEGLEARLTALVLGEASDFEREELERMIQQRPELAAWKQQLELVNRLMREIGQGEPPADDPEWTLPEERRNVVLAAIEGKPTRRPPVASESADRRRTSWLGIVASLAALLLVVFLPGIYVISGWPKMSLPNPARDYVVASAEPSESAPLAEESLFDAAEASRLETKLALSTGLAAKADAQATLLESKKNQALWSLKQNLDGDLALEGETPGDNVQRFGVGRTNGRMDFDGNGDGWSRSPIQPESKAVTSPGTGTASSDGPTAERNLGVLLTMPETAEPPVVEPSFVPGKMNKGFDRGDISLGRQVTREGVDSELAADAPAPPVSSPAGIAAGAGAQPGGDTYADDRPDPRGGMKGPTANKFLGNSPAVTLGDLVESPASGLQDREFARQAGGYGEGGLPDEAKAPNYFDYGKSVPGEEFEADSLRRYAQGVPPQLSAGKPAQGKAAVAADVDPLQSELRLREVEDLDGNGLVDNHTDSLQSQRQSADSRPAKDATFEMRSGMRGLAAGGEFDSGRTRNKRLAKTDDALSLLGSATKDRDTKDHDTNGGDTKWYGYVPPAVMKYRKEAGSRSTRVSAPAGLDEQSAESEAFSTFSLHVSDVSFKLARVALAKGEWPDATKIRIEEFVNALDYGDPLPHHGEKVACRLEQSIHPFLQQRNLLRVSLRTAAAGRSSKTPLRLTLLLDNSGSMERVDREQTVRRAFSSLAQQLKPIDQVTLISFASQPRLLADQVSGAQAQQLVRLIENLPSEGGTNIEAALQLAFEKAKEQKLAGAQNRVIMLTDGAVNLGDAQPGRLARMITTMRNAGIAFDAAGISAEGLNDEVLEALAREGDGRYYLLDSIEAVEDGFARQLAGALRPSAQNVKVQIEFNPKRVGRYKLLGFEKHRLNQEDFRDDSVDAAEMAAAEAGVAVYQFEALPDGVGDIGSVSVRFRDLSTGQMVEHCWPIPYQRDPPRSEQASPSLRLATAAALFAAKLRGEPLGESVDLQVLSDLVIGLTNPTDTSDRVRQLQLMIQQARQISGQ